MKLLLTAILWFLPLAAYSLQPQRGSAPDPNADPFKGVTTDGSVVAGLFGITSTGVSTEPVRRADDTLLMTECRDLMCPVPEPWRIEAEPLPEHIEPVSASRAKDLFLERFKELNR